MPNADAAFSELPIGEIPLFDAQDNALGLFDATSAERITYQLDPLLVRTAFQNGVTPTVEHGLRFIDWELYRRGPNDYVYASWHEGEMGSKDYVGRVLPAADVARLCRNIGFRAPDIVWADLEAARQQPTSAIEPVNHAPPETGIPKLPDRCYLSLKTMLLEKAVSPDKSMTAVEIAKRADGKTANPESFKRPLSTLKKCGYTDSKKGTDGGCWLTIKGINLAKKL